MQTGDGEELLLFGIINTNLFVIILEQFYYLLSVRLNAVSKCFSPPHNLEQNNTNVYSLYVNLYYHNRMLAIQYYSDIRQEIEMKVNYCIIKFRKKD